MRRSASSPSSTGSSSKAGLLLAAFLTVAALPAESQAPRCDAETCPPLQLRLEEGFQVSSQRLEQGMPAAAPAQGTEARARAIRQAQQESATPLSPWLIGLLALVAGMLLQGLVQRQLQRRGAPAAAAAAAETPPAVARATGIELDAAPGPQIAAEPLLVSDDVIGEVGRSDPLAAPGPAPASPSAELDAAFEAMPEPAEEPRPVALFEPEPPVASGEPVEGPSSPEPELVAESPSAELAVAFAAQPEQVEELPISPVFGLAPLPDLVGAEPPSASAEPADEASTPELPAEPPSDELPAEAEAPTVLVEEQQDPVVFELEPLPAPSGAELAGASPTPETPSALVEAPQDPVVFELEPLPTSSGAELADEPAAPEPVLFTESPSEELFVTAEAPTVPVEAPQDPVVFELESLQAQFSAGTPEPFAEAAETIEPADEVPAEPEVPEAAPVALAPPDAADPFGDMVDDILAPLDFQLEPEDLPPPVESEAESFSEEAPVEEPPVVAEDATAVVVPQSGPAPVVPAAAQPAPASDTQHLETVALLRRLSAQRARGLHPEARLAQVFRRISSGRTEAADKALRELEAFCSGSEETFPSELMTTRQYIVRGRDQELGKRIEALRERASDEASGRRLAVAGAFLKRGRFDAVAEVLDELESDLSKETQTP